MTRQTALKLGAAAALLGLSATAHAFSVLTPTRTWEYVPVRVGVVDDSSLQESSIRAPDPDHGVTAAVDTANSARGWNLAAPGLVQAASVTSWAFNDSLPTVVFNDPLGVCTGSCLAATLVGYYHSSADQTYIDDADVFVTADTRVRFETKREKNPARCTTEYYLESVIQHELGHVLGLGHSSTAGDTMYPVLGPCDPTLETIAPDDAAGLRSLY